MQFMNVWTDSAGNGVGGGRAGAAPGDLPEKQPLVTQ